MSSIYGNFWTKISVKFLGKMGSYFVYPSMMRCKSMFFIGKLLSKSTITTGEESFSCSKCIKFFQESVRYITLRCYLLCVFLQQELFWTGSPPQFQKQVCWRNILEVFLLNWLVELTTCLQRFIGQAIDTHSTK